MPSTASSALRPPRVPPVATATALIDPDHDDLILVRQIAEDRTGKLISPACAWRWIRHGVRGCVLEAVSVGGRWYTTERAWGAFVSAQTAAVRAQPEGGVLPAGRSDRTATKLRDAGLLK